MLSYCLMMCVHYRPMLLSFLSEKLFLAVNKQVLRLRVCWGLNHRWNIYISTPIPQMWDQEEGKIVSALSSGHGVALALVNSQHLASGTRQAQDPDSEQSTMVGWGVHVVLPLAEALSIYWGRENHFSLWVWSLEACPCSSRWLHIHGYMKSANWTQWGV